MQMTDSQRIPASRDKVWAALNDPAILQGCIPGCESLEMTSPTEMSAKVTLKVGPVKDPGVSRVSPRVVPRSRSRKTDRMPPSSPTMPMHRSAANSRSWAAASSIPRRGNWPAIFSRALPRLWARFPLKRQLPCQHPQRMPQSPMPGRWNREPKRAGSRICSANQMPWCRYWLYWRWGWSLAMSAASAQPMLRWTFRSAAPRKQAEISVPAKHCWRRFNVSLTEIGAIGATIGRK